MKGTTKHRILEAGAEIVHLKGFYHTGIQEILSAAKVPKGSFYNYFRSKDDFGLQLIDHFVENYTRFSKSILEDSTIRPLERIRRHLKWFIEFFKSKDYAYGCPIGNLAQEMGDLSPAFREKLKMALGSMADIYSRLLAEAQLEGEMPASLDARETAYFLVSSWHGALVHMKAVKGPEPLENHIRYIFDRVLKL